MRYAELSLLALVATLNLPACGVHHAAPLPTFGPSQAAKGELLVGGGGGMGRKVFGDQDWGSHACLLMARYGLAEKADAGLAVQGVSGLDVLSAKTMVRYALSESVRLDADLGGGRDRGFGTQHNSIAVETGIILILPAVTQAYTLYTGARYARAASDKVADASYLFGVVGARFGNHPRGAAVVEWAFGRVAVEGRDDAGIGFYLGIGFLGPDISRRRHVSASESARRRFFAGD